MKSRSAALGLILFSIIFSSFSNTPGKEKTFIPIAKDTPVYQVKKLKKPMKIDADWNKSQWKKIKEINILQHMGKIPAFIPTAKAKMMYDEQNVYVIFLVNDRFVRSVAEEYNGPVFRDACVEFFFSPDTSLPDGYFNLETNAGGAILMHYQIFQKTPNQVLAADDIKKIEIAHSLPAKVDPEIKEPVTWTLEYRIPIDMLKKFSNVTQPKAGVTWRANFFKTASTTSNPHYITWSFVDNPTPRFHLPQFFGTLRFK